MTTVPDREALLFTKLDLKDGYWPMVVPDNAEYNFAYYWLPKRNKDEELMIVIPSALQMRWKISPSPRILSHHQNRLGRP